MPYMNRKAVILILVLAGIFSVGCGSSTTNSNAPFDADSHHLAGWLPAGHMTAAENDEEVCTECHGGDYLGGISGVSCTECHLGGPTRIHPADWFDPQIWSRHAAYVADNSDSRCANMYCHGAALTGVDQSGPSCTSCHLGGISSFHPVEWGTDAKLNHGAYVDANGSAACANAACHGSTLAGVDGSGPGCASCHVNGSYPFTSTGCTSCHGDPPTGSTDPNVKGAHTAHNDLPNVTNVCGTCHNGAGNGTIYHDDGTIEVQFLSVYNAKSGLAVKNIDYTCSEVSCHGGQTTPMWLSGTLNVNTQCTSCHAYGTAEYNSFYSGQHDFHVNLEALGCTDCHDTTKLAVNHFTTLNTSAMEGPASATIRDDVQYNGSTCTPVCHDTRAW